MPILQNKMSTKGGRRGQKSLKSCLRRKSMTPKYLCNKLKFDGNCTYVPEKINKKS